jgi:hypothetical protein
VCNMCVCFIPLDMFCFCFCSYYCCYCCCFHTFVECGLALYTVLQLFSRSMISPKIWYIHYIHTIFIYYTHCDGWYICNMLRWGHLKYMLQNVFVPNKTRICQPDTKFHHHAQQHLLSSLLHSTFHVYRSTRDHHQAYVEFKNLKPYLQCR